MCATPTIARTVATKTAASSGHAWIAIAPNGWNNIWPDAVTHFLRSFKRRVKLIHTQIPPVAFQILPKVDEEGSETYRLQPCRIGAAIYESPGGLQPTF